MPDRGVAHRDSKDPGGGVLTCSPAAWTAFVAGARDAAFERP